MGFKCLGRVLILCLIFSSFSLASVPKDISFFDDKPRGVVKDFHIYRYLTETNASSEDAWKLLEMTSHMSMKLFHAFADKLDEPHAKKVSKCLKMKLEPLLQSDDECLAIKFSPFLATKLNKEELKSVEKRLEQYDISKTLHVIYSDTPFETLIKGDKELFFSLFNRVGSKYRSEFFDHEISKEKIKELELDWRINSTIKYVVTGRKLKNFNKSLIHVDRFSKVLSHKSLFFLGLNALQLRYKNLAMAFFEESYKKAFRQIDKDKILFWQFLVSEDEKYKEAIMKSSDINLYTLIMSKKHEHIVTPTAKGTHPTYDITDPFGWTRILGVSKGKTQEELIEIAKTYHYSNTLPHYAFIMQRASGFKKHYYAIPYTQYLSKEENKRIALIMAIARQESYLIPSAVSTSYALGMMQFMPFLARAIAKEQKIEDFDLSDMFEPKTALKFANIHLDWLERSLYHPLFVAYAYNGGIGFTKRLLQSGTFKKGIYEPFLSMELVHYDESRKYGKKVLANYVIYMRLLGEKVSIHKLIETLTNPEKTDRFR